jgi:glycosyltransferase involved in cell wall biosynthesis
MRILQLGPVPPPHGGVQANLSAIRRRLAERGDACVVIAITKSSEIAAGQNVFHPQSGFELLRLLFQLKYEVIHLHFGGNFTARLAVLALVCGLMPRAKTVLTFHSGGFASSPLGRKAKSFSLRGFAARRFDKIVAVNTEIADLFEKYGVKTERIETIAPHVLCQPDAKVKIPDRLEDFLQRHNPILLSVSLLETHYDVPLQIRVLESIRNEFPNAGLMIIGSGVEEANLRREIAATDYAENISLAGDVRHEIVLHLIKRADVLLRTTLFDGDAISIREALFLGTPVVATDNKMRPENVKLIEIGDLAGLHRSIIETLQTKKSQPAAGNDFSNIDAVLQIYDDLLDNRQSAAQSSAIVNRNSVI